MFKELRSQLHTYSYTLRMLNKQLYVQACSNTNTARKKHMHTAALCICALATCFHTLQQQHCAVNQPSKLSQVLLLTSQPHVHLGRIIVQEHVVQCGDGIEEHSVHLRGEQANQVGNSPTAVDHLKTLPMGV